MIRRSQLATSAYSWWLASLNVGIVSAGGLSQLRMQVALPNWLSIDATTTWLDA